MIKWNLIYVSIVIAFAVHLILINDNFDSRDYFIQEGNGNIWIPEQTNASGHVYPYMATVVTMTCLLILLMLIICFGDDFSY